MTTKVTFNVADVLPKLQQASSVVISKNAMPIFGDMMLSFDRERNNMKIEASDSETWIELNAPIENAESDASICVAATDFCKALANLKGKTIVMTIDDEKYTIVCNYGNGEFKMPYDNPEQYPHAEFSEDTAQRKEVRTNILSSTIKCVSFAALANDMLRPQLNGIRFDFKEDGMVAAGTDGRKLARYTDRTVKSNEDSGFTLLRKPALLLTNIVDGVDNSVSIEYNGKNARFCNESFSITTRLAEGRYPNYNAVIPSNYTKEAVVNKSEIGSAIKRVLQMSNKQSMLTKVIFDGRTITLCSEDYDFNRSATESIDCEYNGEMVEIGLNGAMMIEILSSVDSDNISISFEDCARPALFKPSTNTDSVEFISLLMPMTLNK